eukprot:CAMPEP_0113938558 /NCGR_PEP_ID=MMETSP1339-20121228/4985_1 /TAXON_ID=94617 /ORGANISM="Fibrocapsa japonica" /LENGTH=340 /DNA_ID=CAMNT_0000941731 /DNA_START=61 /DNA_END=1079 /DNA_ORIENTATION=- /assembly_acc=CAM_ASM_000762
MNEGMEDVHCRRPLRKRLSAQLQTRAAASATEDCEAEAAEAVLVASEEEEQGQGLPQTAAKYTDNPGGDPGCDPGRDPGSDSGGDPGGDPGSDSGGDPWSDSWIDLGTDPGGDSGAVKKVEKRGRPRKHPGDPPEAQAEVARRGPPRKQVQPGLERQLRSRRAAAPAATLAPAPATATATAAASFARTVDGPRASRRSQESQYIDAGAGGSHNSRCLVCNKASNPESTISCNGCSLLFHFLCHRPQVQEVPEGAWLCSFCIVDGLQLLSSGAHDDTLSRGVKALVLSNQHQQEQQHQQSLFPRGRKKAHPPPPGREQEVWAQHCQSMRLASNTHRRPVSL